jgi:cell wall-associated NlpC family hydrolase
MTDAERIAVMDEARSWSGTAYHTNAAVKGAGADCAMMPLSVYLAVLPRLPRIPIPQYVPQWHLHRGEELYLNYVVALGGKRVEHPDPGDFVLFRIGRLFAHGGIVLAWPQIIHAVVISGVIYADAARDSELANAERLYFTL